MIYLLLFYKVYLGPCICSCFYPHLTRRLDSLHNLSFAYQSGPSQGWSVRQMLLLFVSCQDWHSRLLLVFFIFTKCISIPWIFFCAIFSAAFNPNNLLRDLLCSWGSFSFSRSPKFSEGVQKWSMNLSNRSFVIWLLCPVQYLQGSTLLPSGLWPSDRSSGGILSGGSCLSLIYLWWQGL